MFRFTLVALAAGLLVCAGAASADDTYQKEMKVTFTKTQLDDPSQAKSIYAELYKTTKKVCDSDEIGPDWRLVDDQACEVEAMKAALADLNRPALTALYAESSGALRVALAERPAARGKR